jgi:hypothetical protein
MSNAMGGVYHAESKDLIGWYEYNGTSDVVANPRIRKTAEEVSAHWRGGEPYAACECSTPQPVAVLLYSSYGGGFWWTGEACLSCHLITGGLSQFEAEELTCPRCAGTLSEMIANPEHVGHGDGYPPGAKRFETLEPD